MAFVPLTFVGFLLAYSYEKPQPAHSYFLSWAL